MNSTAEYAITLPHTTPATPIRCVSRILRTTFETAMIDATITWKRITCAPLRSIAEAFPTLDMTVQTPTPAMSRNEGWTAFPTHSPVSYTHLTLPTNREV